MPYGYSYGSHYAANYIDLFPNLWNAYQWACDWMLEGEEEDYSFADVWVMSCYTSINWDDPDSEQHMDDLKEMLSQDSSWLGTYSAPEDIEYNFGWVLYDFFGRDPVKGVDYFDPKCEPFGVWRAPLYGGRFIPT